MKIINGLILAFSRSVGTIFQKLLILPLWIQYWNVTFKTKDLMLFYLHRWAKKQTKNEPFQKFSPCEDEQKLKEGFFSFHSSKVDSTMHTHTSHECDCHMHVWFVCMVSIIDVISFSSSFFHRLQPPLRSAASLFTLSSYVCMYVCIVCTLYNILVVRSTPYSLLLSLSPHCNLVVILIVVKGRLLSLQGIVGILLQAVVHNSSDDADGYEDADNYARNGATTHSSW